MFYWVAKFILSLYFHIVYRIKVFGKANVPNGGGVIYCVNHISVNDPMVMGIVSKRKVHFMAKKELFKNKFFAYVLGQIAAYPVDREKADIVAFKKTIKLLNDGEVLGIFAEGTRRKDNESADAKAGVALFALKAQVPVIPIGIKGDYKKFSKIEVSFGKPIYLTEYFGKKLRTEELAEITEKIMNEVKVLAKFEEYTSGK